MIESRPKFDKITSFDEFNKYYWYREELSQICKSLGLEYRGTKQELNYIIEQYFKGDLIKKSSIKNEKKQVEIPDVRNLTIKEATKILEEKKLESNLDTDIEVDEKKVVTDMFPKPGVKVNEGSSIILYYNNN